MIPIFFFVEKFSLIFADSKEVTGTFALKRRQTEINFTKLKTMQRQHDTPHVDDLKLPIRCLPSNALLI